VKLLTERETDKRADNRRLKHYLLDGGNNNSAQSSSSSHQSLARSVVLAIDTTSSGNGHTANDRTAKYKAETVEHESMGSP